MANTMVPTAFSYTCCTDPYSSLSAYDVWLSQVVHTNWEVPWTLYSSLTVDDIRLPVAVFSNWEISWSLVH